METRFKDYDIVEELNKGAFCDAYKVRKSGKDYFLKLYKDPTEMSADYDDFKKNQKTMIPILKALGGKTETIIEDFEIDGRYFQVKEFIPGATNLRGWLDTCDDIDERLDVAIQLCYIIKAVHEKNIIHQDLKPEQIMTISDSSRKAGIRIILTDFDWSIPNGKVVRYVGTPGYGNIDGNKVSFKSDIFTLGIILCELLTGCNPFVFSETGDARLYEPELWEKWVKNKDYVTPNKINTDLSKPFNDIIERCLEPNQSARPSIDEILKTLEGKSEPPKKAKLRSSSGEVLIMVPGNGYGRKYFKELFGRTTDADGNEVYKYLDKNFATLSLSQDGSELFICCPANGMAKNKILLNGVEMPNKPSPVKNGDKVAIYSTGKSCEVATFTIEIA